MTNRDWTHGVAELSAKQTFCGRVVFAAPHRAPLQVVSPERVEEVDCPTCRPLANDRARELAEDAKLDPEVLEMRNAQDLLPFLPLLQRELLAVGFEHIDWARDVASLRGFYVLALRKASSLSTVWIRYRRPPAGAVRGEQFVQLSWEQPLDRRPDVWVTADARFIASALRARLVVRGASPEK